MLMPIAIIKRQLAAVVLVFCCHTVAAETVNPPGAEWALPEAAPELRLQLKPMDKALLLAEDRQSVADGKPPRYAKAVRIKPISAQQSSQQGEWI